MENLTAVDGGAALIVVISAILAFSRGLVRELMAILGWVGAAILAFIFAPSAQPLVKELPVVGEFLSDSCELSVVAAFAGVFAIGLIVAALFTPLFSSAVQRSALGGIDQALGFLFGALRGVLLIAVAFIVYDRVLSDQAIPMIDDSRTAKVFANFQANIDENIPTDAPGWIVARYNELTDVCVPGGAEVAPETAPELAPELAPAPAN
ncbi:MAG: CvpA family protein [Tabrizicola sp.]|uniref:CvpA family protein n=1 Tax=Tabrizicola sp. TaxID=2005166 RepID=UPI002733C0F2|nr:CvpA family protein [Tabrizicola sp.]MDP3264505.1 CvpA family protein [Tabrizicola sp.]MDP3649515.1 CvpA family protein [Paracoccaceae bacterium]MDZ4069181.1 CvpA family protein [Tabrizicola sp.]